MIIKLVFTLISLHLFLSILVGQPNIIKNGDLKQTENRVMGNFTRSDSAGLNILNWFKVGNSIEVFNSSSDVHSIPNASSNDVLKQETITIKAAQDKQLPQTIMIGLIGGKPIIEPFVREYVVGQFQYKLLPNKKYRFKCQVYLIDIAWQGTTHFGFLLEKEMPNLYDLSPRYDVDAVNIPISQENNVWQQLDTIITAKGDEEFIRIGVFLPDEQVKLKWKNKQFKKEIKRQNKYHIHKFGQFFLIANISFTAIDEKEWLLLTPNAPGTIKD